MGFLFCVHCGLHIIKGILPLLRLLMLHALGSSALIRVDMQFLPVFNGGFPVWIDPKPFQARHWPVCIRTRRADSRSHLWQDHHKHARQLLDNKKSGRLGAKQLLDDFENRSAAEFPSLWKHFALWRDAVSRVLAGDSSPGALMKLTQVVGY